MTTTRTEVQDAAFWELNICLACGHRGEVGDEPAETLAECPECGEETFYFAPKFEQGLKMIEESEDVE